MYLKITFCKHCKPKQIVYPSWKELSFKINIWLNVLENWIKKRKTELNQLAFNFWERNFWKSVKARGKVEKNNKTQIYFKSVFKKKCKHLNLKFFILIGSSGERFCSKFYKLYFFYSSYLKPNNFEEKLI